MRSVKTFVTGVSLLLLTIAACDRPLTATHIQHAKMDEAKYAPRSYFKNMADNAMLQDMSVADIHFVPHTAEISGTGAARLDRMAHLLDAYGGTVRYETYQTDEAMVNRRIENVREYLAMTGCNMDRVKIESAASGGRSSPADRAITAYEKQTAPPSPAPAGQTTAPPGGSGGATGLGSGK